MRLRPFNRARGVPAEHRAFLLLRLETFAGDHLHACRLLGFRVPSLSGMLWLLVRVLRVIGFVELCRSCIGSCHFKCMCLLTLSCKPGCKFIQSFGRVSIARGPLSCAGGFKISRFGSLKVRWISGIPTRNPPVSTPNRYPKTRIPHPQNHQPQPQSLHPLLSPDCSRRPPGREPAWAVGGCRGIQVWGLGLPPAPAATKPLQNNLSYSKLQAL